jgi:DNA-binding beta-propeller fold protein YncE
VSLGSSSAFRPNGTVSISATATSNAVALNSGGESVVVTNTTASIVFVRFGADPSVTASTIDMPILPGTRAMLAINPAVTYAAVTLGSGSGTVYLTRGDGSFL